MENYVYARVEVLSLSSSVTQEGNATMKFYAKSETRVSINHKNAEHSIRFNTNFVQKEVMSEATNGLLYPCLLFSLGHTTCFNQ